MAQEIIARELTEQRTPELQEAYNALDNFLLGTRLLLRMHRL